MSGLQVAVVVTLSLMGAVGAPAQQAAPRSVKDGVYTTAQAEQGKTVYEQKCASCHGTMATVTPDMAPLLNDHVFQAAWKDRSVGDLFERIRDTMPQNEPGTLAPQQLADIIAHILRANELRAGDMALSSDVEALKQIRLAIGQP